MLDFQEELCYIVGGKNGEKTMTAEIAKTKHRREWAFIHKAGCEILHINPDQEIARFITLAKFISDFTDQHSFPPRKKDFLTFVA